MGIIEERYLDLKFFLEEYMEKNNLSENEKILIEKEGKTKEDFIEEKIKKAFVSRRRYIIFYF